MDNTPIWPLLSTVFQSILEVFLLCLAGYILAWCRIIDKPTQRVINHINISLFTPALLFSKVAFFLSPAKLKELWIIPIFFIAVTVFSAIVASVLSKIFRLKKSHHNFAVAASMFMNSNSLPIALMQSLVISVQGLKWTPDDNTDAMLGRALTYLVLYSTLGMMLRWSYGVRLLSSADTPPTPTSPHSPLLADVPCDAEGAQYADNTSLSDGSTLSEHHGSSMFQPTNPSHHWQTQVHPTSPSHHWQSQARTQAVLVTSSPDDTDDNDQDTACEIPISEPAGHIYGQLRPHHSPSHLHLSPTHALEQSSLSHPRSPHSPHPSRNTAIYHSFPNSPVREHAPFVSDSVTPADSEDEIEDGTEVTSEALGRRHHKRPHTGLRHVWKCTKNGWRHVNAFMTMPLWASLLSLIVACTPPLQSALERMEPVKGALGAAGNCSIPLTLVVLGAYFYSEPPNDDMKDGDLADYETDGTRRDFGQNKSRTSLLSTLQEMLALKRAPQPQPQTRGEGKTVFVAILARMVVVPAVMLPVLAILARFDVHDIFEDPVFVVSNVLLIASPPALTLAQITQAASNDSFERLISRTVFWSYCVVTPPSTILVVLLGLLIAKL
ncbi:membrane transport protein-domain-containing protein [Suillus subalutaceus]|uniref:membrane transport protein-domain-containing protein n=1 Tax=Suillus subalutaceus TaxID=48586 RepID=UPI001B87AEF8|nr:membrane transport protein-domain-containing protein [Suillus subalutaceus]KAG1847659.1 membrane transport protein-domain-containing protein [Suillus subalutaceus]